jgi:hypothetical protein
MVAGKDEIKKPDFYKPGFVSCILQEVYFRIDIFLESVKLADSIL